jgi:hypothetical protein
MAPTLGTAGLLDIRERPALVPEEFGRRDPDRDQG